MEASNGHVSAHPTVKRSVEGKNTMTEMVVRHRLAPNACAQGQWNHDGLNRELVEAVMAYTDMNGHVRKLKN
jgi:hypothetical protein